MKRHVAGRGIAILFAVMGAGSCFGEPEVQEPAAIARIAPAALSDAGGWRLFDRSIASAFRPTGTPLVVTFDRAERIAAIKVRGPAPYRLEIRGDGDSSLGFEPIDLSSVPAGWHAFASRSPELAARVVFRFESTGGEGEIPEVELWSAEEARLAARVDLGSRELPAGHVAYPSSIEKAELAPGACASFPIAVSRAPSQLRRAHLAYGSEGLLRAFEVRRSLNGRAPHGGAWLGGDPAARSHVEEIDPATLNLGANEVRLCLPAAASRGAAISAVRIVGEFDRGVRAVARARIGTDGREGRVLLDGNPDSAISIGAGERVTLELERLIAPDAIRLSGAGGRVPRVECVERDGGTATIAAEAAGSALRLEGGASACAALELVFDAPVTISEAEVAGSGAAEPVDWPRVIVTSAAEHFGTVAWVGGFTARPPAMAGAIRVEVASRPEDAMTGDFGKLVERAGEPSSAWAVRVHARFPDGAAQTREVILDQDLRAELERIKAAPSATASPAAATAPEPRFAGENDSVMVRAAAGQAERIRLGTHVGVDVPAGAVSKPTDITVRHLGAAAVPPLDPGMINVTAPRGHGYEFLPHGQRFAKPVEVIVPFDPQLIPEGMSVDDVQTYYFDPGARRWRKLERRSIDLGDRVIRSATDHFTIVIDAVLAAPTNPTPLSFDPTALASVGAASPASGIDLIEPPLAIAAGDARMTLPIRIPAGRGAFTPSLAIAYSSASENGWLGVGWDLSTSKIEIDTRWGVPTYADDEEPRYLLDGAPLVPTLDDDGPACADGSAGRRYHARVEGAFAHILRCGDDPSSYHFEVRDRDGTKFVLGSDAPGNAGNASFASYKPRPGSCTPSPCPPAVYRWNLRQVVDTYGNTTIFNYQVDDVPGAEPGRDVYLQSIAYTSHPSKPAAYAVEVVIDDGGRPDRLVSGRPGFKLVTRRLLRAVRVKLGSEIIREYVLTYAHGQFDKTVLASVRVYGTGGCAAALGAFTAPSCSGANFLDEHRFTYFAESQGFAAPVEWTVNGDPAPTLAALGKGGSTSFAGSLSLGVKKDSASASFGAHGSFGNRGERVGTYDVNGDGLIDQVFETGTGLSVLYNQGGTAKQLADTGPLVQGLTGLGRERQHSWGVDARAGIQIDGFGASLSGGFSNSTSRASRFLTDLDGDGFIDLLAANGDTMLSASCPAGHCFTPAAFGATSMVSPSQDPLLGAFGAEIRERAILGDPVIQWTAPYSGRVNLTGTVVLARPGTVDGISVGVHHQDLLLFGRSIVDPNDPFHVDVQGLDVQAGEAVYLHVGTGSDDGIAGDTLRDEVEAALSASYTLVCLDSGCASSITPFAASEPTGAPVFDFDLQELRVNGTEPFRAPAQGELRLVGLVAKQPSSADIRVCVQRFPAGALETDFRCNDPASPATNLSGTILLPQHTMTAQPLNLQFAVALGDLLVLRAEADYSFDPAAISFVAPSTGPALSYLAACVPNDAGTGCTPTTDPEVLSQLPLDLAAFGFFAAPVTPPEPAGTPPLPFVVPHDGNLYIEPFAHPLGTGPITIAARSDRKGTIKVIQCDAAICNLSPNNFDTIIVETGESISIEILAEPLVLPPSAWSVTVTYDGSEPRQAPLIFRKRFAPPAEKMPFVGGYRGWRTTLWNELKPFAPAQLLADYANPSGLSFERLAEIVKSAIAPLPSFSGAPFIGPVPAWIGPGSAAFVSEGGRMHAARLGLVGLTGPDVPIAPDAGVFSGNYARLSGTRSYYVGAGIQGGDQLPGLSLEANIDGTVSRSDTRSTTDVVDLTGDGIADVLAGNRTFAGTLTASPGPQLTGFQFGDGFRRRTGLDYSIGFGAGAMHPRTTAGGRQLSADNRDGPGDGGLGYSRSVGLGIGRSQTTDDLVDVNGDGLLDLVQRRGSLVNVRYSLGREFGALEPLGAMDPALANAPIDAFQEFEDGTVLFGRTLDSTSDALAHETTLTQHETTTLDLLFAKSSKTTRKSASRITRQLADLNGDGLPDLLLKRHGQPIRVQFNRGGDFGPAQIWATPSWTIGATPLALAPSFDAKFDALLVTGLRAMSGPDVLAASGVQSSTAHSGALSVPIIPEALSLNVSGSRTRDTDTYELALIDIDGDGDADHVLRRGQSNDPAFMYVKRNQLAGRANLLRAVHRPLGGSITLDYGVAGNTVDLPQQRHVLARVEVDDGIDLGAAFASPNLVSTFAYEGGRYHRHEKQFLGFAKVTTTQADGSTTEQQYENASLALHGRLARESRRNGANQLLRGKVFQYEVREVLDSNGDPLEPHPACTGGLHPLLLRVGPEACTPRLPLILREDDIRAEGGSATKTRSVADASHDRFGHPLTSTDTGDDAIATDDLHVTKTYEHDTARWILGRANSLVVRAGSATGTVLRSRAGEYNVSGDLRAFHVETGAGTATTRLHYDDFGNVWRVETPPNENGEPQVYSATFDPIAANYPISVVDGFGYASTASYDLRFGVATTETDVNGAQIVRTLDAFGRLDTVRGPYDSQSAPALEMDYYPQESPPRAVTVTRAAAPADYAGPVPAPVTTAMLVDGFGRTIELRKTAVVDGVAGMSTSGLVQRDGLGRATKSYHPFFTVGASTAFVIPSVTAATSTAYDALHRPVLVTHPDNSTSQASFDLAPAPGPNSPLLFRASTIDENGKPRETFTDHLDRMRAFVEHPTAATSSATRYDYFATGELAVIIDAENNPTQLGYDLRGFRTSMQSGDTGLIEQEFDLLGNRVSLTEPNHRALGTEVRYLYERDRLASVDYPSKPDVTFAYGAPGASSGRAGRIAEVTDESGSQKYFYGALGEVRRTTRKVASSTPAGSPLVFDLRFTTDSLGRQLEVRYPDGEVVASAYDAGGMLAQVTGSGSGWTRTYADQIRYDVFGNRTRLRLGNGAVTTWSFDPARVRLDALTTTLPSSEKIQDLHYTYDPAGNPLHISNTLAPLMGSGGAMPGASALTMTYDGVGRLTSASGQAELQLGTTTTYSQQFIHTSSHNLTTKSRVHLVTNAGGSQAPPGTNFSLGYGYEPARPHLVRTAGDLLYGYDASGNPLTRTSLATGAQQTLVWDDDNRLVDVTSNGVNQHNTYDAGGLRVRRKSGARETVFSSPYFDVEDNTQGVKHVFAGPTRIATALDSYQSVLDPALPDTPAVAYYFHGDHLGSTSVLTDEFGAVHQSIEYFIDGETWIDRAPQSPINGYQFNGKPFDADTGFYDYGQRFYDPRTSLWLGLDPALTDSPGVALGRPMMLAHGAYAAHSPRRFIDPDGRSPTCPTCSTQKDMFGVSYQENRNSPVPPEVQFYQASERTVDQLLPIAQATKDGLMAGTSVVPFFNATVTLIAGDTEGAAELYLVDAATMIPFACAAKVGVGLRIVNSARGATEVRTVFAATGGAAHGISVAPVAQAVAPIAQAAAPVAQAVGAAGGAARGGAGIVRVGQAGEAAVRSVANIGPKVSINVAGRTRIPDGLTSSVLTEVKNVSSLSFTQQLRDFAAHASANGLEFDLWVRPTTRLSGTLLQETANGAINLRYIP